jgi:hypothetical protein
MNNINKLRLATLLVIGMLFAGGTASYAFPFMGNNYGGGYHGGYGGGFNNRMFNGGNMFNGYNNGGYEWRHRRYHRHGW